jgi:hypothetical protein
MNIPEFKINRSGFEYYSELPENFRLASIDDFIVTGKRRIGLIFLIQWVENASFYQVCYVSMNLTRAFLDPFLADNRVFVCAEQ